jgi:hypothetical protein
MELVLVAWLVGSFLGYLTMSFNSRGYVPCSGGLLRILN